MRTPGYGITPDRFVRVAHLLPRQCGNVAVDNHTFVNALLWMCRTGAPWRDLPECYGKWVTVYQCVCSIEVRPMQRNYSVRKSGRN